MFAFRVDKELHTQIKILATRDGKTIQDYVIELLKKDIESKKQK